QDPWITVTQINPRGRIHGIVDNHAPLQPTGSGHMGTVEHSLEVDLVVDFTETGDIHSNSEESLGEFGEDRDSISSEDGSEDSE
ncbi:unnamed protein product, partial [Cochlearia groenlandica]